MYDFVAGLSSNTKYLQMTLFFSVIHKCKYYSKRTK